MQYAPIVQASRSSYCQFAALAPKELPYNEQLVKVSRKEAQKARTDFKAQQRMLAQVLECQWDLSVEIDDYADCPRLEQPAALMLCQCVSASTCGCCIIILWSRRHDPSAFVLCTAECVACRFLMWAASVLPRTATSAATNRRG